MAPPDLETRAAGGDARAQVELAERLDADGRHEEAINWLARAGHGGDPEALTRLGLRLVTGRDAPHRPADGATLLTDAAKAGHGEAAARLAVLLGLGYATPQNWPGALDALYRAAELGDESARAQLRVLGRDAASSDWAALVGAINANDWLQPAPVEALCMSPMVITAKGLVDPAVCAFVMEQSKALLVRAELYDPETGAHVLGEVTRQNRIANFGLLDTTLLNLLIQARIAVTMSLPVNQLEAFAVLHYQPGEEYGEHFDYLDPAIPAYAAEIASAGQRIGTCLLYLNDDYEGGETEFPQLGIKHRGATGDALIFFSADPRTGTPEPRSVHAGRTPTSGEKWVLSQFVRNRPVIGSAARRA